MLQLRFICSCESLVLLLGCVTDDVPSGDVTGEDTIASEVPLDRGVSSEAGKVLVSLPDGNRTPTS
jgi:hypothetical protein